MFQPVTPTGPPPGTPSPPRKTMTIVLSIIVVVLVAAAGLFLTLFLVERGAVADANTQISDTQKEIGAQKDKLSDTRADADELEQQGKDLQSTHDKLQACSDSAKEAIAAGQSGDQARLSRAIDQMLTDCDGVSTS